MTYLPLPSPGDDLDSGHAVLITVPDPSKKKLANGRAASVAAAVLQAARLEGEDIGTNPTESSIDPPIPIPFLLAPPPFPHATRRIPVSLPLRLPAPPSFLLLLSSPRFDVPPRKLTRALCLPYPSAKALSACFSPLPTFAVIPFSSFRSPTYLSIRISSFSSLSIRVTIYL